MSKRSYADYSCGDYPAPKRYRYYDSAASKKRLNNQVKKILNRYVETKRCYKQAENVQLYHNMGASQVTPQTCALTNLLETAQSHGQNNRLGDKIRTKSIQLKLWLSSKKDRPNVIFRVIVFKGESADCDSGSNAILSTVSGSSGNFMLRNVDTDKYVVLHDDVYKPPAIGLVSTEKETSQVVQIDIPFERTIEYKTDNGQVPAGSNYINCLVIPYDAFGSVTTDNVATCAVQSQISFTDL